MLKVHCQTLINLKHFQLLTARHSSFYQLRISIFSQPTNQKKTSSLFPYLILTPDKPPRETLPSQKETVLNKDSSHDIIHQRNSFETKLGSIPDFDNKSKNCAQIDSDTNSFLSKTFLAHQVDQLLPIDELVLFKGSFDLSLSDLATSIQNQQGKTHTFNRIYVNCELFLVNNFSTESVGEWYGYTLADEGTVALSMRFFSFNSSSFQTEITFLWTSIQFTQDEYGQSLPQKHLVQISQFLQDKYVHISKTLSNFPSNLSYKINQLNKNQKNSLQTLKQTVTQYNQKVYEIWKKYQDFQLKRILNPKTQSAQNFLAKLQLFQQNLAAYHWKNHIIVTEQTKTLNESSNHLQQQNKQQIKHCLHFQQTQNKKMLTELAKLKKDLQIDSNLVFYPFQNHQKMIKLQNQDFKKIASISSLTSAFSNHQQEKNYKMHLMVFVHGYQASGFDMQNLAAFFKYKQPGKIKVLVSTTNEGRTQQPLEESGHRLAIEIKNFVNNRFEHQDFDLSFVCHSMGGLITRAALKYLQLYRSKFRTFLSLCSPHLGYLYHTSTLVKTSLWVLNQVKKDPSMIELTMEDNPKLEKTFMYQLSTRNELEWFEYPIFVGSVEDEYIPFWSALLRDKDFFFETKEAKVYKQLYKNMTERLESKIIRLEAIYKVKINDISSFVGRTAHIRILNCIEVMEMIYLLTEKAF